MQFIKSIFVCLLFSSLAVTQSSAGGPPNQDATAGGTSPERANLLKQLDSDLERVVSRVSPAVVQILTTGYGPEESRGHTDTARIVRQHAIGSGVIVDPNGYIITNAHVVEGAQRVRVVVTLPAFSSHAESIRSQQIFEAKVLGTHKASDLALLKIQQRNLPTIPISADLHVHQGELVFAVGSPEGLRNSVTMGVVSAVARQTETNDAIFYIQTDAPLNPGNSGGPLVDIDGNLVGINTFMLSEGGGSEGLGFAIPAMIVKFDYENLRKYGHVQRAAFGATAQGITPNLAAGLGLSRSWGVILADVATGGFAQVAGLQVGDIVVSIDGRSIDSYPAFVGALYLHPVDDPIRISVMRGEREVSVTVPVLVHREKVDDLADVPNLQRSFIAELGMFVSDVNEIVKPLLHEDDADSGVVVIAQAAGPNVMSTGVQPGDVIRAINRTPLQTVSQFQNTVRGLKPGDPVVLQIEREGKLQYLATEMD